MKRGAGETEADNRPTLSLHVPARYFVNKVIKRNLWQSNELKKKITIGGVEDSTHAEPNKNPEK